MASLQAERSQPPEGPLQAAVADATERLASTARGAAASAVKPAYQAVERVMTALDAAADTSSHSHAAPENWGIVFESQATRRRQVPSVSGEASAVLACKEHSQRAKLRVY
jgi:hypothetical protein